MSFTISVYVNFISLTAISCFLIIVSHITLKNKRESTQKIEIFEKFFEIPY
jgi:hypothetical protein